MQLKERPVTRAELDMIYEDFRLLEISDGVPQREIRRIELVLEEEGRLIGYASGITEHKWLYLTDLWIEENRRRQGLGSRLLRELEQRAAAEGMEHVYLWTSGPGNPQFYEHNGYQSFAVLEDKYELEGYHQTGLRKELTHT